MGDATFGHPRTFYLAMAHGTPRPAAAPTVKPSLPIIEVLILLVLICVGLTVRVDLSRLRARAGHAATANPGDQVPTGATAPVIRPAARLHQTMS